MNKLLLLLIVPLFAFTTHKFYVSVTNVSYSEKDKALQITSRIFIDDLDAVLKERYNVDSKLATAEESKLADSYLEKYLRKKFQLQINGESVAYTIIGRKYDTDVCIFYLEAANLNFSSISSIQIQNEVLTDLYDEQQNVVHFKVKDHKKSFVLVKSDTKGMLNL